MTVPSPYLEGLLAAVQPGDRRATALPQVETRPEPAETAVASAAPDEHFSPEERIKRHLHPLDSFTRLLDCASANRPPDPEDGFRFQWFGLFYQAPEQDAFTLRLRLPGGRIKPFQLAGLASVTQRYGSGQVLFNSQGGLDIPGVPIASATEILEQVESIGLSALRTGGDCVQAVRGGELDGSPAGGGEGCTPVYPLVRALEQALAYGFIFSDLPLPCEIIFEKADEPSVIHPPLSLDTIILRIPARACSSQKEEPAPIQDACFFLHFPGEAKEGFLLPFHRVVSACLDLLKGWAAGADRSSREKASLAAFLAGLGPDRICTLLGGAKRVPLPPRFIPVESESSPGFAVPGGRLLSGQLAALQQCCQTLGWQEVRLLLNHLYVVGADGKSPDATDVMRRALSV